MTLDLDVLDLRGSSGLKWSCPDCDWSRSSVQGERIEAFMRDVLVHQISHRKTPVKVKPEKK